MKSLCF